MAGEMSTAEAKALREPFPASAIGSLPKPYKKDSPRGNCDVCGGYHGLPAVHLDYVGHAATTDRLLAVDPEWSWEPMAYDADGGPLIRRGSEAELWIKLTICGVTRIGVGTASASSFELSKQLIGDAIRNAAMRFGVALDLWAKEDLHEIQTPPPPPPESATTKQHNEIAARLSQLTEEQSETLRSWWKAERISKADNLNTDEADLVIGKLDEIAPEAF